MEISSTSPPHSWLTAKEAAAYLGVTPTTLYSYVKMRKNRPPFFRLAGKPQGIIRFPREEFIQWANGSKQG
jgi:excisionase family DNA binding protein